MISRNRQFFSLKKLDEPIEGSMRKTSVQFLDGFLQRQDEPRCCRRSSAGRVDEVVTIDAGEIVERPRAFRQACTLNMPLELVATHQPSRDRQRGVGVTFTVGCASLAFSLVLATGPFTLTV